MPEADDALPEVLLGRQLRALREKAGWSQEKVAQAMIARGFPWRQSMAAKTEAGQRPVRVNELVALAGIFNVSPTYLLLNVSDDARGEAFRELVAGTSRIYRAQDELTELRRQVAEAEVRLQTAIAERQALSERFNEMQEAARQAEGGDGGEHREEA